MKQPQAEIFDAETSPFSKIQTSLARQFLHGLIAEWENAIWMLPESIRYTIKQPLFSIRSIPGRLGSWDCGKREITIHTDLIYNGRWDDVKDVLLHEMAHQVAHEGLHAESEPDHGKKFQKACQLLNADPRASGTYRTLHERLNKGDPLSHRDKIVVKIHKLLALAESTNINEANAAMKKAHELILQHNVDLIGNGINQEYHCIFLGKPRLRHFREFYHLAHLLQDFYFIQGIWIEAWVLEKGKMGRVLEISGTRTNVQIAEYVYETVLRYIDTTWVDYKKGKKLNRHRKTDFAVGIIEGFRTNLRQTVRANASDEGKDLPVKLEDHALTRFVARRYPHMRSFTKKRAGHDANILNDGKKKGRQLVIAKGISQSDGYKDNCLEYHERAKLP